MRLIAESPTFREIVASAERVSATDAAVLLRGEPGTGKDTLARRIHAGSSRRGGRFVVVDCRVLPEELVESELFGHRAGAFSGAERARAGRFASADGGTLYLDGIDELSLPQQARFLRAIESKEFLPLGASRPCRADFRVVTASSTDLRGRMSSGLFREDLYYRLNVVELALPPLRERPEDIPHLARAMLAELARRYGKPASELAPEALAIIVRYPWPGNLHELRATLEAALGAARGARVEVHDLPVRVRAPAPPRPAAPGGKPATDESGSGMRPPRATSPEGGRNAPRSSGGGEAQASPSAASFRERVREFERRLVLEALATSGWDLRRTAASLGLERHQLRYLCAKLDIRGPRFRRSRLSADDA